MNDLSSLPDITVPKTLSFLGLSPAGFHTVSYRDWGGSTRLPVVIGVHGLLRTSTAFDMLAQYLSSSFRMVCPDVVGRGESDWLSNPSFYDYPQYLSDMAVLIGRLNVSQVHWVGTSMGGLMGMILAAQPKSPIKSLVLNDIGPFISRDALRRIVNYAGMNPVFSSFDQAQDYIQTIHGSVGAVGPQHWQHITQSMVKKTTEGTFKLRSDPLIERNLQAMGQTDVDLWSIWNAITCPVLVLHGTLSDILTFETVDNMQKKRTAPVHVVHIEGVGHVPALVNDFECSTIKNWLVSVAT